MNAKPKKARPDLNIGVFVRMPRPQRKQIMMRLQTSNYFGDERWNTSDE